MSSGQRRRLMLARARYKDPPLLLLDEVTSNLDAETAATVIRNLADHPATKVIATHDPQVLDPCDAVFAMERGRLTRIETDRRQAGGDTTSIEEERSLA